MELKQRCSRKLQSIRCDARKNFPEYLVLGPDQLDIIREINQSESGKFIIFGEAGCGKSFVLLYLLYKYTAKDLSESQLKKVYFFIPHQKTEYRKFVKLFVDEYCHSHLINICDIREDFHVDVSECELGLGDEDYDYFLEGSSLLNLFNKFVCAAGFIGRASKWSMDSILVDNWKPFYLRKRYRNPANISMRCSNLYEKQEYIRRECILHNLFFTCLSDSGVSVTEEDAFKLLKYDRSEDILNIFDEISREMLSGETVLLVTNMSIPSSSYFVEDKCTHIEDLEGAINV